MNTFGERQWEQPALIPHPKPEVPARPARPEEIPSAASKLAELAQQQGWYVEITYARGTSLTANGRPGRVVDSIAVRAVKNNRRLVATWVDGKRSGGWGWWLDKQQFPVRFSANELKDWVKE